MKPAVTVALALLLTACGHAADEPGNPDHGIVDTDGSTNGNSDAGSNVATLSWDAPTTYTDGTPLTVAGYHVYFGTASGAYETPPVDAKLSKTYAFAAPSAGTYYFAVTAYDSSGSESVPSSEVMKSLE